MKAVVFIRTDRLILRTVAENDIEIVRLHWKADETPLTREEAIVEIDKMTANHRQNAEGEFTRLCLAILCGESGDFVGWCGLDHEDKSVPNPVIFYILQRACWGKGYATEAVIALLKYIFEETSIRQIDGACSYENTASRRVMEKAGMKYIGLDSDGGHFYSIKNR